MNHTYVNYNVLYGTSTGTVYIIFCSTYRIHQRLLRIFRMELAVWSVRQTSFMYGEETTSYEYQKQIVRNTFFFTTVRTYSTVRK